MPVEQAIADEVSLGRPGLRSNVLSPVETLSQSISAIAPTTSPALTVPLVFALAGNGTWLAYLFASGATLLMALCIARFAKTSASPGSLYKFATDSLPPSAGYIAAWALLLAYISTGASVVGGFINFAHVLMPWTQSVSAPLLALGVTGVATALAFRNVQTSARLMLLIEAVSVSLIVIVICTLLARNGLHIDQPQVHLEHVTASGVRLGVVLALFSFVGFESATTLGHEARNPLRTIPRAVVLSAVLAGIFFVMCCYTETLEFHKVQRDLGASQAPFRTLAAIAGIPLLGTCIDTGALISMFACTLACVMAAARVLMQMAGNNLVPASFGRTHRRNETPHLASLAMGLVVFGLPACLAARGASGADIYGWMGSLAVYGFITVYLLVAAALPVYLRRRRECTALSVGLSIIAGIAMMLAMAGTLYPVPDSPYNWLPYIYVGYLGAGLLCIRVWRRASKT